jgi:hypothetical protein
MSAKVKVKGATYYIPSDRIAQEIAKYGAKENMIITHDDKVITVLSGIIDCSNENYLNELLSKVHQLLKNCS